MRRMEPIVADPRQALPSLPAPTLEQLVQSYGGVLLAVDGSTPP